MRVPYSANQPWCGPVWWTREQWFYDAAQELAFCRELDARGAVWNRARGRDMSVIRWREYYE